MILFNNIHYILVIREKQKKEKKGKEKKGEE